MYYAMFTQKFFLILVVMIGMNIVQARDEKRQVRKKFNQA